MESKSGRFMEKDKRILEELKSLHCDPHPYCRILPSESDFSFWKILLKGPPETPYENGVFELYCEFGAEYPVKPPVMKFLTPIYHCNVNNVGRICHNIFDRNYSAQITMREILDAVYGLLIAPEPEDPLDSVLAEEYQSNKEKYEEEARKNTKSNASISMQAAEQKYAPEQSKTVAPPHLICPLTKKLFIDPVKTKDEYTYERQAIEEHIKK
uniref:UBC core domain-containing protein n=1 Tax=Astyanax mexicanus TaxID=7994 RepID=A0A3B1IWQ4_ASTMX